MRVRIHRGSKEIGGSCVELESDGQRLIIDFGLPLTAEKNSSQYLPRICGLDGNDPSLLGILISHPHLDHFGLLAHLPHTIPIGMGTAARRILTAAVPFLPGEWTTPAGGWDYESGKSFKTGPFQITPILVDHSAYDSYALYIQSGGKSIFYSGDFRAHGRKAALFDKLVAHPPRGVDALLLEGSSIGRIGDNEQFATEGDIEAELIKAFSETEGLAMVHTSSQNIDRIVSILRASRKTGRKLVIDLYTAVILEATGNQNIPQSDWPDVALYIPQSQRIQIKNGARFDLLKHHAANRIYIESFQEAPGRATLLFRPLHIRDLEKAGCLKGAAYIYSQWEGYWERGAYDGVRCWLEVNGIPKHSIHTSGHAGPTDLKKLVSAISPRRVIPIHSFAPERYPEIFVNSVVEARDDGEWWEV